MTAEKQNILQKQIDYIVSEILKCISNVETILLCGSYGRNEGAWILKDGGQYIPYNDYDFIVVSDQPNISKNELNQLRKLLAAELSINWVDIDIYSSFKINNMKATQKNIDITFGSKKVYGKDIDWNLKPEDTNKLSKYDIETLYFTRIWTFLGTYSYREYDEISGINAVFFRYQMAKAILACVDVILIKNHNYHSSYIERVNRVISMSDFDKWNDMFSWSLRQKLEPESETLSRKNISSLYDRVLALYYEIMKYGLGKEFVYYENTNAFDIFYILKPRHFLVFILHTLKGKHLWNVKYRKVLSMQNRIFIDLCKGRTFDSSYYEDKLAKYFEINTDGTLSSTVEAISVARNSL